MAVALAAAVFALGVAFGTLTASGADSYGYVSQGERWLHGRLVEPAPWIAEIPWPNATWTFSPLGYRPHHARKTPAIVPVYAPGLPMLMAGAEAVGGACAPYLLVPLSGAILVLATFALGRRLGEPEAALVAALLVATSPTLLFMLMWPMSDVPVAAAWAVAFVFSLGRGTGSALAAGAAAAAALLVRPNHAPGVVILGLVFLLREGRAHADGRGAGLAPVAAYGALVAVAVGFTAAIHRDFYGSVFHSGYGPLATIFAPSRVSTSVPHYLGRLGEAETPLAWLGLAIVLVPLRRYWPRVADRVPLVAIALFVAALWAQYSFYLTFGEWWSLRFLLATWPFVMLGSAMAVLAATRRLPHRRLLVAAVALALACRNVGFAVEHGVANLWREEHRYSVVARAVRERTEPGSVVLAMQHSGSVRHYAGRLTLRYDILDGEWLDRAVEWLEARGTPAYLVADDWEMPAIRGRFRSQQTLARLARPILVYSGTSRVFLFDLGGSPPAGAPTRIVDDFHGPRCVPSVGPSAGLGVAAATP